MHLLCIVAKFVMHVAISINCDRKKNSKTKTNIYKCIVNNWLRYQEKASFSFLGSDDYISSILKLKFEQKKKKRKDITAMFKELQGIHFCPYETMAYVPRSVGTEV